MFQAPQRNQSKQRNIFLIKPIETCRLLGGGSIQNLTRGSFSLLAPLIQGCCKGQGSGTAGHGVALPFWGTCGEGDRSWAGAAPQEGGADRTSHHRGMASDPTARPAGGNSPTLLRGCINTKIRVGRGKRSPDSLPPPKPFRELATARKTLHRTHLRCALALLGSRTRAAASSPQPQPVFSLLRNSKALSPHYRALNCQILSFDYKSVPELQETQIPTDCRLLLSPSQLTAADRREQRDPLRDGGGGEKPCTESLGGKPSLSLGWLCTRAHEPGRSGSQGPRVSHPTAVAPQSYKPGTCTQAQRAEPRYGQAQPPGSPAAHSPQLSSDANCQRRHSSSPGCCPSPARCPG